jgi:hypothetical protein
MRRHRLDPFCLVFGAIFLSVGIAFCAGSTIGEAWRSIWPMVAAIVGVTLAAWAAVTALSEGRTAGTVNVEMSGEDSEGETDATIDDPTDQPRT